MAYTTINDPQKHFNSILYSPGGATSVVGAGFQPDLVWIKSRTNATNHNMYDSSRGQTKRLYPNTNDAEDTVSSVTLDSDGFSFGDTSSSGIGDINVTGKTYVSWNWKANGGTTTTNDASSTGVGSIDSVYQANTTAGFSIVTYTGTGSAGTVAHGIGVAPTVILTKRRDDAEDWVVLHLSQGNDRIARLNTTDSPSGLVQSGAWNDTSPTSTVFSLGGGSGTNGSGRTIVAYCFAEIQGYSKFGSYTGNGNANGTFIYTGFKPAWLMIKKSSGSEGWHILDHKRDVNENNTRLQAESTGADDTSEGGLDMLSNGFKIRTTWGGHNTNTATYIYMAFAESPFVTSNGGPANAR